MTKDVIARASIRSLEALRAADDRRYAERYEAQQIATGAALAAQQLGTQAALNAAKEAVLKAENAAERRFEAVNEFRAALSDQARDFATKAEVFARLESMAADIKRLEGVGNNTAGRGSGASQLLGFIIGAAGVATAIAVAVFK